MRKKRPFHLMMLAVNGRRWGHFPVSIAAEPVVQKRTKHPAPSDEDVRWAIEFVQLNGAFLTRSWHDGDMDTGELLDLLVPLGGPATNP